MLISREELRFDFGGATFELANPREKKLIGWIFNQFLYGEVTGIQCGHWLYHAPHLNAAAFLAKQAGEEISHVRRILRILALLEERPAAAHWAIRFLSTGMMGASWGEHVALEMALGEGLVLGVFYAMAETISEPEIKKILETAAVEEERHVEFGERETLAWLAAHPETRPVLLGMALIQLWALQRLKSFVMKRVARNQPAEHHAVMKNIGAFYDHSIRQFGVRIERLGLSDRRLDEWRLGQKFRLLAGLPFRRFAFRVKSGRKSKRLLTATYLNDPLVEKNSLRAR